MSTKSDFEMKTFCVKIAVDLLVRSWVEIYKITIEYTRTLVDLLVRSWVEILILIMKETGRVGRPPREVVSWNKISAPDGRISVVVDLLVRSWVEIIFSWRHCIQMFVDLLVSWNRKWRQTYCSKKLSTSSWGRELKYVQGCGIKEKIASTSLRGRELKFSGSLDLFLGLAVDLLARSWVQVGFEQLRSSVDLLVRSWVEITSYRTWSR